MEVSEEITDATKRNVSLAGMELKKALKLVLTRIEPESQAIVLRLLSKLEHYNWQEMLRLVKLC